MTSNLETHRQYRTWRNSDMNQEVLLSKILARLNNIQTAVTYLTEPTVVYDATWDFVGTMVGEEDVPESGLWYWGGYNAETEQGVFWDYGWTVRSYNSDLFDIITESHNAYDGLYSLGTPVYKDNSGKFLGKNFVMEISSAGFNTPDSGNSPSLVIEPQFYSATNGDTVFNISEYINDDTDPTTTFFAMSNANQPGITAQEIDLAFGETGAFYLSHDTSPMGADDSFTITTPIRVRILMSN